MEGRRVFPAEGTFSVKILSQVRTFRNFGQRVLGRSKERSKTR